MNFEFTEEQQMLQKAFRDFAKEYVAPHASKWDEEDRCPVELFPKLGQLGVLGCFVPEEYGGLGLGHTERIIAMEELARYSAGLVMFIFSHQLAVGAMCDGGSEEQKKKYLPGMCDGSKIWALAVTEPGGGTDLMGHTTIAEKDGDEWVISGRKCFITNNEIADYAIVTAKTGVNAKGRNELSAFIIPKDAPGYKIGRGENKMGVKGSISGDMVLTNVRVPDSAKLGRTGAAAGIALKEIGEIGRASVSAICVGLMKGCLEEAVEFSEDRIIYGKTLNRLQAIQFHIAEIRTAYEAGRLLVYRAAYLKDKGVPTAPYNGMAKLFCTNNAVQCAQHCIELMGGYGLVDEYPVGRYMRDALASISAGGTNEVQKMVIYGDTAKEFSAG